MAFDGIVVNSVASQLSNLLTGGKFDKIYQPEQDEIILGVRNNGQNYKLLISASASYPRIHLFTGSKSNPATPPTFCMVLRKHLSGAKICQIRQLDFDRIIEVTIESLTELEDVANIKLMIEIMGRHSNIILLDHNNTIIDSIIKVNSFTSRYREVLPGKKYILPPPQEKLLPLNVEREQFLSLAGDSIKSLEKFILSSFSGVSPLVSREICFRAGLHADENISQLIHSDLDRLYTEFKLIFDGIKRNIYSPTIIWKDKSPFAFSALDLRQFGNMERTCFSSISETIETFYFSKDNNERLKQKSEDLHKIITTKLDRNYKKLGIQLEELLQASDREKYRVFGDLLMANLYAIKKGDAKVTVQNFYDINMANITIDLEPRFSAAENAQRYYKLYNKYKNAANIVQEQIAITKEEIAYLEGQLMNIENSTTKEDIEEIRQELMETGYLRKRFSKVKNKNMTKASPLHYVSSDGWDIYVGKTNTQNDFVTTKLAEPKDIWFHTKEIPGSHVVVKAKEGEIPENTIKEAATLASYYSKARLSSNVPVDYTYKKHVKKPSGSKPGFVIYTNQKTIYVTPNQNEIKEMKEIKGK